MWLRGSGTNVTEFGSWGKVWTSLNDGPGTDLDADRLDNRQGNWYQNALNINYGTISDNRLPEYQTTKSFNNSIKVLTTTNNPRYKIYLSGVLLSTAPFLAGLEVNLYNANGQGTGTILITNVETIDDANDNTNDYTVITGSLQTGTFIGALTIGTASNRIAFQDFSLDVSGTYQTASLDSDGGVARLRLGRKDGFSSSPTIYFNSSQLAATNYNAAIVSSGGNATDGSGSLNVIVSGANGLTVNNNAVWNAGNVTFNSTNVVSTAVIRDASGNFAAGTITAALTGAASLNVLKTGDTMTGSLTISGASSNLSVGGTLGVTGNTTLTANLVVDTNTLYVNATDDLVGIGLNPTTSANNNSKLQIFAGAVGTTVGNTTYIASFESTANNYSRLTISHRRHTAGATDWTTTSTRIQQRIDVTDQAYIEFNPPGSTYGVSIGTGAVEGLRVIQTGEVGIGKTPTAGYKLDVGGIARVSTSIAINDASGNSGAPILFLGSSGFRNFRVGNQLLANDVFEITPSTAAGGSTWASTPALAIRGTDSNISIGSTIFANPGNTIQYKLNVNGNINFNGTLYQNDVAFVTSRWTISANGTDVHRLSKVGINKADPAYTLDISGDENITGKLYVNGVAQWLDNNGVIRTTSNIIAQNVTIPPDVNASSIGPVTVSSGFIVTLDAGAIWTII
jgi:hypothetical protein